MFTYNVPTCQRTRRIVVGPKEACLVLADAYHAGIVRVNTGQVNIKIREWNDPKNLLENLYKVFKISPVGKE